MHVKPLALAAALSLGVVALPAAAQNCAGFSDVLASNEFCPNVEWLKNRAVTLGCGPTPGVIYCPNDPVSRIAMAAFMNRLGIALTPAFVRRKEQLGSEFIPDTAPKYFCQTAAVAAATHPRSALVRGALNLYTPSNDGAGMEVKSWVVYSTNGGSTWNQTPQQDGYGYGSLYSGRTPPDDVTLNPMTVVDLDANVAYQFALATQRVAGTSTVANMYCENLVQVVNRNGTSSPFDAPPATGAGGRGD